jgi:hypothetical protein
LNVFDDVAPAASVAVTVKSVLAIGPVGVPLTRPVFTLKVSPIPVSAAGVLTANVVGAVPPAAVTGVNDSGVPCVPIVLGTAWVVVSAPLTVSWNVCADVAPAASVTVTVNVVVASVVDGVPLTWPFVVLKLMPVGSAPPVRANAYGVVPPAAVTGMNVGIKVPIVPVVVGTACVVVSAGLTVSWNVFDEVAPTLSVTVTVNVVVASVAVGVPLTSPFVVLKLMPVGSVPPESANAYGTVPPLAVTGVKPGIAVFIVPARLAIACVVVRPRLIVREKTFDDCVPAASVTVTVKFAGPDAAAGVPVSCPVAVLKVSPAGSAGLTANVTGTTPPAAVTGMTGVIAVPLVPATFATASVVVSAAATVNDAEVTVSGPAVVN